MPELKIWKTQPDPRVRAFHSAERYPGAFDELIERAALEHEMWVSFMASLRPARCILSTRATPPAQ